MDLPALDMMGYHVVQLSRTAERLGLHLMCCLLLRQLPSSAMRDYGLAFAARLPDQLTQRTAAPVDLLGHDEHEDDGTAPTASRTISGRRLHHLMFRPHPRVSRC